MNYEQMYKDALERARSIRFGNPNSATANVVCEDIFPELKENEDEKIRKEIIHYLEINASQMTPNQDFDFRNKWLPWLKKQDAQATKEALRTEYEKCRADAIAEIQKPNWSEEDEYVYNEILKRVADKKLYEHDLEYIYKWLKSIRPQNRWKPSDKQMTILKAVVKYTSQISAYLSETLESLYSDLQKL